MNWKLYTLLLVASAFTIIIGAVILRVAGLVPLSLTYLTFIAAAIVFSDSYFVYRENRKALSIGVILGIIAMISASNPAHFNALEKFGSTLSLSLADITLVIGFYLLPMIYIAMYAWSRIREYSKHVKKI
ncbi:hypothetical protein Thermo_00601 [Thermoplasmatales archaeon]|nr:hypothetical protein Thermo_00601 [Thermoplasmatales archaeon]